jgi:hypothetical protein
MANVLTIPPTLYRIYDCRSVSPHTVNGFWSGDQGYFLNFDNRESMKVLLELHANWYNRRLTPFISTSSSLEFIAREIERRTKNKAIGIAQIDTTVAVAHGAQILSMKLWVDWTAAKIPERAKCCAHEWLFVGYIPEVAVVESYHAGIQLNGEMLPVPRRFPVVRVVGY